MACVLALRSRKRGGQGLPWRPAARSRPTGTSVTAGPAGTPARGPHWARLRSQLTARPWRRTLAAGSATVWSRGGPVSPAGLVLRVRSGGSGPERPVGAGSGDGRRTCRLRASDSPADLFSLAPGAMNQHDGAQGGGGPRPAPHVPRAPAGSREGTHQGPRASQSVSSVLREAGSPPPAWGSGSQRADARPWGGSVACHFPFAPHFSRLVSGEAVAAPWGISRGLGHGGGRSLIPG